MAEPTWPWTISACCRAAAATACCIVDMTAWESWVTDRRFASSVNRMSLMEPDKPATTVTERSGDWALASTSLSSAPIAS